MGFWIIVFIVVCVVSAFYERFGKRDPHIKERSKQPPQLQRPTPVVQPRTSARSAETLRPTPTHYTNVLREISRVSTDLHDSMALHMRVQEATEQLSREMSTERI